MSDNETIESKAWSHKMTGKERREAIEEALGRQGPLFRLTEGQVGHIGRVERQVREPRARDRRH